MEGIYICYNEKKTGDFKEAIEISNREYLMWRHPVSVIRRLKYPTKIIIKVSGENRYYKGDLLLVKEYAAFKTTIFYKDTKHRPFNWKNAPERDWKSVLFMSNLQEVLEPVEVRRMHPPQGVRYIKFKE
jgi:hypothetical protein